MLAQTEWTFQKCWTSLPRWQLFVLVEGEGASKVETRLTVGGMKKGRLDLSGDLALLPETAPFLAPYLWDSSIWVDNQSQEIAMGELQSHPSAQEDRMFELLESANLFLIGKMNYCGCSRTGLETRWVITLWEEGLRQRLFSDLFQWRGRLVNSANFTIFVWWSDFIQS